MIGLYVNPPDHALVLSMDERRQTGQPIEKARWETSTSDDKRNGTASFFVALHALEKMIPGHAHPEDRRQEFLEFLRRLDSECSADFDLHLVLDHYSPQHHPRAQAWLQRRPRFYLHFVPIGSSWIYLIETRFPPLIAKAVRRGSFGGIDDLVTTINRLTDTQSGEPNAFIWTASGQSIPKTA